MNPLQRDLLSTSPSTLLQAAVGLKAEYTVISLLEEGIGVAELPEADSSVIEVSNPETCSLENYLALPDHSMDQRIGPVTPF